MIRKLTENLIILPSILLLGIGLLPGSSIGEGFCRITLEIPYIETYTDQEFEIPIYLINPLNAVGGFEIWLILERPDVFEFLIDLDTLSDTVYWLCTEGSWPESCTDSLDVTDSVLLDSAYDNYDNVVITEYEAYVGSHCVAGTLIENWEYIFSRSIGEQGHDLRINARANYALPMPDAIPPQDGTTPLLYISAQSLLISDSLRPESCRVFIMTDYMDSVPIYNQWGESVWSPYGYDTVYDTSWFVCSMWQDDSCLLWQEVPEGPIDSVDSFWCCDTVVVVTLDTNRLCLEHGLVAVLDYPCGDINQDAHINILDIGFIIECLYGQPQHPCNWDHADINCSGAADILDISMFIAYLYLNGPELNCCY